MLQTDAGLIELLVLCASLLNSIILSLGAFLGDFIKLFLAAFLGATCAFAYERRSKKNDERAKHKAALYASQFALGTRISALLDIHEQHLEPQAANPNRWAELTPFLKVDRQITIPAPDLAFLLDHVAPDLLGNLVFADSMYGTVIGIIAKRNESHDEFQRLLEKAMNGLSEKELEVRSVEDLVGDRSTLTLKALTNELYKHLESALIFLHPLHMEVGEFMEKNFKEVNALQFEDTINRRVSGLQKSYVGTKKNTASTTDGPLE
jgi:hypothetical protein